MCKFHISLRCCPREIWLFSGEQIFISPLCTGNKCIVLHNEELLPQNPTLNTIKWIRWYSSEGSIQYFPSQRAWQSRGQHLREIWLFRGWTNFHISLMQGKWIFYSTSPTFCEFCQMKYFGHLCLQWSKQSHVTFIKTSHFPLNNIVFPSQQYRISLIRNSQDLTFWYCDCFVLMKHYHYLVYLWYVNQHLILIIVYLFLYW
jgi:hypothetical protein